MFNRDHAAKVLFGNSEAVANLVNEALFQGQECFRPEQFHILPTEVFCLNSKGRKKVKKTSAVRDALWRCDSGTASSNDWMLIGLEFQSKVDYFMPGRLFLNAALNISAQHREIGMDKAAEWGKRGYPPSEEYLSRFGKEDKVVKPLTIVVHFGKETWDGPMSLNDISRAFPPELAKYDYDMKSPVVVLDKIPIERVRNFEQNLKMVLLYAMGRKDSVLLKRLLTEEPGFRRVPRLVAELIKALFQTKIRIPKDKEEIDMCLAEEQMIEEGKKEVLQEGAKRYVQMCRNANMPRQEILSVLKSVFLLSAQKAAALLRKA